MAANLCSPAWVPDWLMSSWLSGWPGVTDDGRLSPGSGSDREAGAGARYSGPAAGYYELPPPQRPGPGICSNQLLNTQCQCRQDTLAHNELGQKG